MRWSNLIKTNDRSSEKQTTVLEYLPKQFVAHTPEAALDYLNRKKQGADFVLSDVLREVTGVEQIEKQAEERLIESKALELVAKIQKQAFDEGYTLGKDEGYQAAFEKRTNEINRGLEDLSQVAGQIHNLKPELVLQNESHFLKLIYQIAEKIIYSEIEKNPEMIIEIIKKSVLTAQTEESVTVVVAQDTIEFLEKYKTDHPDQYEFFNKIKFVGSVNVKQGGCIVETNYGAIDAQIEQRLGQVWSSLSAVLPKAKSTIV